MLRRQARSAAGVAAAARAALADSATAAGFVAGSAPDGRFGTTTMGFAREVAELFLAGRRRTEVLQTARYDPNVPMHTRPMMSFQTGGG